MSSANGKKPMAEKKKKKDDEAISELILPIEYQFAPDITSRYVNHCLIQWGEHECKLSFFDLESPLIGGSEQQKLEQVKKLTSVRAACVGRIILSRDFVPKLIDLLQRTSEKALSGNKTSLAKLIGVHDEPKQITGS